MLRSRKENVLKAATWYTISNLISKSIIYICTPLYTRLLSTLEYGQYSNFISWQSIVTALITCDMSSSVGIAYMDYGNEDDFNGFISTISICAVLIPALFVLLILSLRDQFIMVFNMSKVHLLILSSHLCFCNTLEIYQTEQRSKLKYKLSSALTLTVSCGGVLLTLILVSFMRDKLVGILLGNTVFNAFVNMGVLVAVLRRKPAFRWDNIRYALAIAIPLIPHILAGTILGSSDKVMITKICGDKETAFYSLIYTMAMMVTMLASSINKAWVPWFFERLSKEDDRSIKNAVRKIFPVVAMVALIICLFAPEIVLIIGGRSYLEAVDLMPPLITHCVCNFVNTLYINIEFYNKKTFAISIATVISSVVNLCLNYIFINKFGYQAAAYTTLFSSVLTLIFHLYKVKKQGMMGVFDNRYNLITLLGIAALCLSTLLLYRSSVVRYGFIVFFAISFSILIYKNKDNLCKFMKHLL